MTDENDRQIELPSGWAWVPLGDVVEILDSRRVPINQRERDARCAGKAVEQLYPYFGANGQVGWIDDFLFEGEAVLVGEDGAPFLDRAREKSYLVNGKYWVNNHAHILRSRIAGLNAFICHQLNFVDYSHFVSGTTRLKLTQADLVRIRIALPPQNEARRIAERIDDLFGEIEAGEQELEKAREGLAAYRRAVLKAAVTGELTREWREKNAPNDTGANLLTRVLAERRERWERREWKRLSAKGREPRDELWKRRYVEPAAPDVTNLPTLPQGWVWASLDQLSFESSYGTSAKCTYEAEGVAVQRPDFQVTTSNKQLNFLQHIMTILREGGIGAVVMPDNVLFEAGAGEKIRKRLLNGFDFHTLLRLPTGIFYKQGVKANVLFFDKKPASETPWTKDVWIYDFRTNQNFTLKERPLRHEHLEDFISVAKLANRHGRTETERFRRFAYDELVKRDKLNLDIFWLKDASLEDPDSLPPPDEIAAEIVESLEAALQRFRSVAQRLS